MYLLAIAAMAMSVASPTLRGSDRRLQSPASSDTIRTVPSAVINEQPFPFPSLATCNPVIVGKRPITGQQCTFAQHLLNTFFSRLTNSCD